MKDKHLMPLLSHLMSMLLLYNPVDPLAFLVRQINEMINFRDDPDKPVPILFNDDDLANVFKGIDFMNRGSIDLKQYFKAMNTLGLNLDGFNRYPEVDEDNRIECKVFVYEA
ncbi:Hypothetical protein CINCED_3A008262 [Cinara cedri]|uniref:EFCAB10 C-terminal EF-hand domain-containing protein n=1 Tax=Cinara cedri TaxID=506608 RepID=A0A5E4NH52_9HEMI|nr:Hypothetical protein CINCED_3A008262 [Cinara cedri]